MSPHANIYCRYWPYVVVWGDVPVRTNLVLFLFAPGMIRYSNTKSTVFVFIFVAELPCGVSTFILNLIIYYLKTCCLLLFLLILLSFNSCFCLPVMHTELFFNMSQSMCNNIWRHIYSSHHWNWADPSSCALCDQQRTDGEETSCLWQYSLSATRVLFIA